MKSRIGFITHKAITKTYESRDIENNATCSFCILFFYKKPQPTAGAFGCGKKKSEVLSNVGGINHIRKILKYDELKSLVQYDKGKR